MVRGLWSTSRLWTTIKRTTASERRGTGRQRDVRSSLLLGSSFTAAAVIAGEPVQLPEPVSTTVAFATDVQPLLEAHCLDCHGPDAQESSFRVDRRQSFIDGGDSGEPAVLVGNSRESHLIQLLVGTEPSLTMPPNGDRLSAKQIGLLRAWIDQGLEMPKTEPRLVDAPPSSDHWALQPLHRPPVPNGELPCTEVIEPAVNPIDPFIRSRLHELGLQPSPPADPATLIRRVYLDALGILPTPNEVEAFVNDVRPDAYDRLVDRVLANPQHGERWARHWLDVVRFAESNGFETNHERPAAYHYRDYVVRAFNHDLPFDRFVFEQLAGDAVGADAATGFLVGGANDVVSSPDPVLTAMQRQDELADMVNTTGTALLGLTIGCARCHNHKFDPVTQTDYYAIQAVLAGVRHGSRPLITPETEHNQLHARQLQGQLAELDRRLNCLLSPSRSSPAPLPPHPRLRAAVSAKHNLESFAPRSAKYLRMTVSATNTGSEPCLDELEVWTVGREDQRPKNVALASAGTRVRSSGDYSGSPKHKLEHLHDGRYGNDHSWISNSRGSGWVELEFASPVQIDRLTWGRDRTEQYQDRLPVAYRIEVASEPGEWHLVASSEDRLRWDTEAEPLELQFAHLGPAEAQRAQALTARRSELQRRIEQLSAPTMAYIGRFESPGPTHRLYRGDPLAAREPVAPDTLSILGTLALPDDAPEQQRRVALANSIIDPANPLTARVMANRLWHYHFGRGLVATPSDFGAMGAAPSHPELLDWLAAELRDGIPQLTPAGSEASADSLRWSLKHLHRLILLSATYRQASGPREEEMARDADSRLLWRFPPRRLEAEAMRDNILHVSGSLDRRMEGPGFWIFHPSSNYARNWVAKEEFGPAEFRRMLYATKLRMEQDPVFGAFDCPDGGQIAPQRTASTTPIQALNLFNSLLVVDQAERFAERVRHEAGDDPARQVAGVFLHALGRSPEATELSEAVTLVREHGLAALCRAIYNSNAFLFLR